MKCPLCHGGEVKICGCVEEPVILSVREIEVFCECGFDECPVYQRYQSKTVLLTREEYETLWMVELKENKRNETELNGGL